MVSYHIQVYRSSKQKHGGYLNSPDVYRGTGCPDSRRLCHTMALRGGENCLRSQELCRLHGLSENTLAADHTCACGLHGCTFRYKIADTNNFVAPQRPQNHPPSLRFLRYLTEIFPKVMHLNENRAYKMCYTLS